MITPTPEASESAPLRDQVTRRLRDDIVSGRLRPGTRLTEVQLGHRYFVSRSPVRHALRAMTDDGLVTTVRGLHRLVTRPDEREVDELFTLRSAVEPLAVARAAERPDLAVLRQALIVVQAGERAVAAADLVAVSELNTRFHQLIVDASQAPALRQAFAPLALRLTWLHPKEYAHDLAAAWVEHRGLLDAIISADPALAVRRAHDHLLACRRRAGPHAGAHISDLARRAS